MTNPMTLALLLVLAAFTSCKDDAPPPPPPMPPPDTVYTCLPASGIYRMEGKAYMEFLLSGGSVLRDTVDFASCTYRRYAFFVRADTLRFASVDSADLGSCASFTNNDCLFSTILVGLCAAERASDSLFYVVITPDRYTYTCPSTFAEIGRASCRERV